MIAGGDPRKDEQESEDWQVGRVFVKKVTAGAKGLRTKSTQLQKLSDSPN